MSIKSLFDPADYPSQSQPSLDPYLSKQFQSNNDNNVSFGSHSLDSLPSTPSPHHSTIDFEEPNNANDLADDLLASSLNKSKEELGITRTAQIILDDIDLKKEMIGLILSDTHTQLKTSLRNSILTADKKDRQYLSSLTPSVLCTELKNAAPQAYQVLAEGMLGISDLETIPGNQHLINVMTMLYSTVAKTINRKATGYGLLLTTVARDGGMREDSMKLLCNLCHPRTAQKYDTEVLSFGWDDDLREVLNSELLHFNELRRAELSLDVLDEATPIQIEAAAANIELLKASMPLQVQLVWDNLNIRSKHKYERKGDKYEDSNFDWMASIFIQERISANHMEHSPGSALKEADEMAIEDFVPTQHEKTYLFGGLVHYYASRLTFRHPKVFNSLNSCIKASLYKKLKAGA